MNEVKYMFSAKLTNLNLYVLCIEIIETKTLKSMWNVTRPIYVFNNFLKDTFS